MAKSSTERYNLEKVAEVLSVSTAEVNRLREQGKLRGFRDGSTWQFNKEEVHSYFAKSLREKSGEADGEHKPDDSDFDLGDSDASSFDLLVEDAILPDDSDLISVAPASPVSDLDLAALDHDELSLAEETQISSLVVPKKVKPKAEPVNVIIEEEEDSSALLLATEEHDVLVDEASVLEAGASSPQLGLAGDSGFDMLVAGEDESVLLVAEDDTDLLQVAAVPEFELEPPPKMLHDDDSESSSQVIALDAFAEAGQFAETVPIVDPFGQPDDGFSPMDFVGFDSGVQQAPRAAANDPFGTGDAFAAPAVSVSPQKATAPAAEECSSAMLGALVAAAVLLLVPGIMLLDTMVHMWSWGEPFLLNSILMDTISGLFGL